MIATETPMTLKAKAKAVDTVVEEVVKKFGAGSIYHGLNKKQTTAPISVIPTGIPAIDNDVLVVGGFPRGRIIELFGPEMSGKTTLALHAIAQAQKMGLKAHYNDAEYAYDPVYAAALGVNNDEILLTQPDNGEQALEITEMMIRSEAVDILVIDSVAALVPQAELDGEMGDSHMGLQARLMSQALRKLTGLVGKTGAVLIFINQLRDKIGVTWGSPETTTGGKALKFYASVRLDIRRIGAVKQGEEVIGNKTKVKSVKNKCAPPFKEVELEILYGKGFDVFGPMIDAGLELGLVEASGSWFSFKGGRMGQGREAARQFLRDNPAVFAEIDQAVKA